MLHELLEQVLKIRGVTSATVVDGGGKVVSGVSFDDLDLNFVKEILTSGMASSRVLSGLLGEGETLQTMLEYERGPVLLTPLERLQGEENPHVAIITLDSTATFARARLQLKRLLPKIASAVTA